MIFILNISIFNYNEIVILYTIYFLNILYGESMNDYSNPEVNAKKEGCNNNYYTKEKILIKGFFYFQI
jgi:hypothetical protein